MTEDDVKWIVNDLGELGVEVNGRCFFLYKGESLEYGKDGDTAKDGVCLYDDGTPMRYRIVGKREFGETCHPITCMTVEDGVIYDRTPFPYTKTLTYTPGLSFGKPKDGDWKPLPAAPNSQFIAAANPATVLELISHMQSLEATLRGAADDLKKAQDGEIKALRQRDELLAALKDARELVDDWGAYASNYMQEKHDLEGDLERLDAAISKVEEQS